jgi:hypothetical protein
MGRTPDDIQRELATLLRAATEDPKLRGQMRMLLQAPAVQRRALVAAALDAMARRGEPAGTRAAFGLLATEAGASAMLELLDGD